MVTASSYGDDLYYIFDTATRCLSRNNVLFFYYFILYDFEFEVTILHKSEYRLPHLRIKLQSLSAL